MALTGNNDKQSGMVAFESVLEADGPRIHSWLVARVGPDRADDVFQDTMIAALKAWEGSEIGSVRAWLFTIARNKAIDDDRSRNRRPELHEAVETWPSAATAEALEDPIWDEVRGLPEKQRVAVTLRYRGDLTHREIGKVMGISETAARRNAFEGLKNLRERIENE